MERRRIESALTGISDSGVCVSAARSSAAPPKPSYNSRAVTQALEHLASIDLIELCNEAKFERCRATRDLSSCGRPVQFVLCSCGHASLCAECSQRCDLCPICRIPIPKSSDSIRLRLYNQCIEAGLISKRCDDWFLEKEEGEKQANADVQRLYSLFDVAMENNMVSLICHYVTDVCMDESAVSSDPVIAFLLDEVVVKDWCKRTFKNIISELQASYSLRAEEMKTRLSSLLKFSTQLAGISNVLEVLDSSFRGTVSAKLEDLHHLQESIIKINQHMEIMIWCIRHQFLENVKSRYTDFASWHAAVRERKLEAINRAWPDSVNSSTDPSIQEGSLFIEDALLNLDIEGYASSVEDEIVAASLQKDGGSSIFRSKIEGVAGSYPYENLRDATDVLFLHGSSDLAVAKRAIFLYYLFDRHWTLPDEKWRHIVNDFAANFGITRHSMLESLTFYLLDDNSKEALQEAVRLLPEIAGPLTHPKVAQVLLERQNPDAALTVLRWSGHGDGSHLISVYEAVIAVRVRVQSGLLTEAFMYQRMLCTKVKENSLKHGLYKDTTKDASDGIVSWVEWMEALVGELCCLCIWRKFVDQMIDLPWNSEEEKYLHKCLLEYAMDNPTSNIGSLLVSFYLKRYRYVEAYKVDCALKGIEEDFISKSLVSKEVLLRMRSASEWRTGLVDKCIDLLPEVQRQQVKSGKLSEIGISSDQEGEMQTHSKSFNLHEPDSTSLLLHTSTDSASVAWENHIIPLKPSIFENPSSQGGFTDMSRSELVNHGSPSILQGRFFTSVERGTKPSQMSVSRNIKFDDISSPGTRHFSPVSSSPLKEVDGSPSRVMQIIPDQNEILQNGFVYQLQNVSTPYSCRITATPKSMPGNHHGLFEDSTRDPYDKRVRSGRQDRTSNIISSDDPMDTSWSNGGKDLSREYLNANCGMRWRTDESSDDDNEVPRPQTVNGMSKTRRRFGRR